MKAKLLPIAAAVAAVLAPMAVIADTTIESAEQPTVLTTNNVNTDLVFSGYARYGLHHTDDFKKYVGAEGQLAGVATGRLGNEGNGGEFQFTKAFVANNGAIWDVAMMLEHWDGESNGANLKKFYASATNIFDAQPNATLWAGRDFHQRPQQGLNDYFWMEHDGQGGGVYNLELGSVKLDFSVVAQSNSGVGDNGNYAFTSKLHGIDLGGAGELSFLANYGFESDQYNEDGIITNDDSISAYQIAAVLDSSWSMGSTKLILRYAENADNSVFNKTDDLTTLYASLEGNIKASEKFNTEYLVGYHDYSDNTSDDRTNYSAIVRPMYSWNSVHSTWLEAGYSVVDYADDAENTAWKVTLSQNVSFDVAGARPMIRLYATVGEADNQVSTGTYNAKQDTLALGLMFESWW